MAKRIFLLALITFCVFPLSRCKDSENGGGADPASVRITISPSKEIVVEPAGGELSFSITSQPPVSLQYAYSTSWIKTVGGKETTWLIEENKSEISRNGRIYILNAATMKGLDTIYITQKSVSGTIIDNEVVFSPADVPVSIPFAGNSYIAYPENSGLIDNYSGKLSSRWVDKDVVISTFFRVGASGDLNVGFVGSNNTGTSRIRFSIDGKTYDVTVSGPSEKIYGITTLKRSQPGYVRVDMQGLSKSGSAYGDVLYFRIGGPAANAANHFVTEERMAEDASNGYFFRRGASVHYFYTMPTTADVEYFYNEATVTEENAVNGTYYMMNGFSNGYMGIQQVTNGERKVLFSVWSPYQTDNPADIPEEMKVKLLRKGANVTIGEFGNEGSGGQSWLNYSWKPGVAYKALVGIRPDGKGNSIFTGYFFADNEWKLIASFSRPQTHTYYKGAYSFLENFVPGQSIYTRAVSFSNQWARLVSGEWREVTEASFSMDDTGRSGMRYDVYGEVDKSANSFVLKAFGFFDEHTGYGTIIKRNAGSSPPVIDFDDLDHIPSVN